MHPAGLNLTSLLMSPPYSRRYGGQTIQQRADEHDQDLKRLIDDALAVQDGLNTIKNRLANLDSAVNTTPLTSLALDCQEVRELLPYAHTMLWIGLHTCK